MTRARTLIAMAARHRNLLLFIGALACAGVALTAGSHYLDDRLAAERARLAPPAVPMERVVVARRDLQKGDPVTADSVAIRPIPRQYASADALRPDEFDRHAGMRLLAPLRSGEQLLGSLVRGADSAGFSARLRPGIRALTITVDEVNSISGMLQPGDRVDLFFSARAPKPGARSPVAESTLPLLQNLLVLATGRQVRPGVEDRQPGGARAYSTITIEVPPLQAQQLVVAQRTGRLTAVLRHPDDRRLQEVRLMDVGELLGRSDKPPAPGRLPQIIVGGLGRLPTSPTTDVTRPAAPLPASAKPAADASPDPIATVPGAGG